MLRLGGSPVTGLPRVIVTGSRALSDRGPVFAQLDIVHADLGPFVLVHGACPTGADRHAVAWAAQHRDIRVEPWPASLDEGRWRGPDRNRRMCAAGAILCLGFREPGEMNDGTDGCLEFAVKNGIPTREFTGSTVVVQEHLFELPEADHG